MKPNRIFAIVFAVAALGAVAVGSLPSFNPATDRGKVPVLGSRKVAYAYPAGVVSVADYGADNSGGLDSLAAFKSAIAFATGNACISGGTCSDFATGPTGYYGIRTCASDGDCAAGTFCDPAGGLCGTPSAAVHVPYGRYVLSDTLHLRTKVRLYGDGPTASVLMTAAARTGITVNYVNTAPTSNGNAGGSTIDNLGLQPSANATAWQTAHVYVVGDRVRSTVNLKDGLIFRCTVGGTSHASVEPTMPAYGATVVDNTVTWTADYAAGIWLRAQATVTNVRIGSVATAVGYAGNGLQIIADTGGSPPTNANGWRADGVTISISRANGAFAQGSDANRGVLANSTLDDNEGWGVHDASFLGNTWRNLISQSNGLGGYKCTGDVATSLFYDCYSESDEPASTVEFPASVVGGLFAGSGGVGANGFTGSNGSRYVNGVFSGVTYAFNGNTTDGFVQTVIGNDGEDEEIANTWRAYDGAKSLKSGTEFRLKYWHGGGYYRWDLGNSDFLIGALIATEQQSSYPDGLWVFPLGIAINNGADNVGTGVVVTADDAAPTTGDHDLGDIVINKGTAGPLFWKNIVAGAPGTWLPVGGAGGVTAATGTTQGTATPLTMAYGSWNVFGAPGTGVVLPSGPRGTCIEVFNAAALITKVYPPLSDTIDGGAANTAADHPTATNARYCLPDDATNWRRF